MANGAVFNSGVIATLYRNEATGDTYTQLDLATKNISDNDVQRRWRITPEGDFIGLATLGVDAISGYFYLPSMPGGPIGVPTDRPGQIPLTIDTVSKTLYGYIDSAWESLSAGGGGGGSPLTVEEVDGSPSVANVTKIVVPNGSLTDDGGGNVTLTFGGGGGAVSSVFGRTGAVVAVANDYTWAEIDKTTSSLADLATRDAGDLSSGTLPDARFPATLPAVNGSLLTGLNAANLASGLVPAARIQEVIALADLTDVSGKTGSGSTAVMDTSPTIVTPTIAALANLTSNGFVKTSGGDGTLSVDTNSYALASSVPAAANPTASVGLSAVNGAAATYMRSDGAPALSQAIVPTWTAQHIYSLGLTPTEAILLSVTPRVSDGIRDSHALMFRASTRSGSNHVPEWKFYANATTNAGLSQFVLAQQLDSGGWSPLFVFIDNGTLSALAFNGNGTGLTDLSADNITSGTLLDTFLTTNVVLIDGSRAFTSPIAGVSPVGSADLVTKGYADALVVGLLNDRGNHNASGNTFPSSGGSGTAGAILKGDLWTISVAGTLGGAAVTAGDTIRALTDTPGSTPSNWAISETNIGYVALNAALNDGQIYIGNSSNIGTARTPSGDVTISNTGVTAIGALKVTNAMLAGSIVYSKLTLTGSIVDADVSGSAAITWTKISKSGSSLADLATRSATDLTSGTLPDARFPATLPAVNGSLLTNLNATQLLTGTVPAARIQEVIALADLTDVSGKTGSGSTAVMDTSPTIVTPTIAALANLTTDGVITTTGGNGTLSVQPNAFNFIWYRDCV